MVTGYITLTELISAKIVADKAQLDSSRIQDIIARDVLTPAKRHMSEGVRYYNSMHDILANVQTYFLDGNKVVDQTKSNFTLTHPFHKILVDQKAAYIVGNPIVVSVAEPDIVDSENPSPEETQEQDDAQKFQEMLLEQLTEGFDDLISDWIIGASNKGVEWIHFYIKEDGELEFCIVPAEQIIPVYDTQYQEELLYVIRFYTYDLIDENTSESKTRYKVEWWSKDTVEYWAQQMDDHFIHDPDYEMNPGPHWASWNTAFPSDKKANGWGRVPFVPLLNNSQTHTDLRPIKTLVDAYDKVKSGWVNDLADFQELVYVLKGYAALTTEAKAGLSELAIFMKNLKTHKVITTEADGDVTTLKAEIPIDAKEKFLDITRKEIFFFGEGIDVNNENFRSPSGVALKFLYSSLDLKANRMIRKLKDALSQFMWFVVEYINQTNRTTYDFEQIVFTMNKAVIFNEKEKIDSLVASEPILSKETILANHPYVDDVNQELARLDAEEQANVEKALVSLENVQPDGTMVGPDGKIVRPPPQFNQQGPPPAQEAVPPPVPGNGKGKKLPVKANAR